jgi:hypothetical protein
VSYGGDNNGGAVTRLDFDLDDYFAKADVLSAVSFERLGLLVCTRTAKTICKRSHLFVQPSCKIPVPV